MVAVYFEQESIELVGDESLLEGLSRAGHDIPSGCRAGVCQACLVVVEEGEIPASAQKGLSAAQKSLNYALSCQCHPSSELSVRALTSGTRVEGKVVEKSWLNESVLRLRIKAAIDFKAGQFVTVWKDDSVARCYSIASLPSDGFLELHIRVIEGGLFSDWAARRLEVGAAIPLQGPLGQCIYSAEPDQSILMMAIGTGLAPIVGVLREALNQGHRGNITVLVGAADSGSFYLVKELLALKAKWRNLEVRFIAKKNNQDYATAGDLYKKTADLFPDLKDYRVYVCGGDSFVAKARKQCFMAGANMKDISADVFLPSGV